MKNNLAMVLGANVNKSLSPIIFNYWFLKYSIGGRYNYKEIKKNEFNKQIKKILNQKDICGLNITIPFKEEIIPHLDSIDEDSKKIGAVNCVTIKKNKTHGSNTDWVGYSNALKEKTKKHDRIDKEAIIIGYGGAAKAILYALLKLEYKKVHIFNRTLKKLKNIENSRVKTHPISDIKQHIKSSNLIINTTPVNVLGKINTSKILSPNTVVSDVVYRPLETSFLKYFKNPQRKIYGASMLINQAAPCFKKWFGVMPIIDEKLLEIVKKETSK